MKILIGLIILFFGICIGIMLEVQTNKIKKAEEAMKGGDK
jgi:hypothetical protein